MKTIKNIFYVLMALAFITSCSRDYDLPPLTEPVYDGATNNITIAEFKDLYASATTSPAIIDTSLILKATVVGNDVSGNIYKQLYLQDETGGIIVGIEQSDIYTNYKLGQQIFLDLDSLAVLTYGGEIQIGYKGTNASRVPWAVFTEKASLDGWPDTTRFTPNKVNIADFDSTMKCTLIELDSVYFVNEGKEQYAVSSSLSSVSQTIKDSNKGSVVLRTSVYADFAADSLPVGYGTVVGVLNKYNGSWQFTIRSIKDVKNFTGETAVFLDETLLSQDSFDTFTAYNVTGNQVWSYAGTSYGAKMSGYSSGNIKNEDWLISPAMDLSSKTSAALSFDQTGKYFGTMSSEATLWISTDYSSGAPSSATWTQLTIPNYMTGSDWTFVSSGSIDLSSYCGNSNVHFAFKYISSTSNAATWEVKNVLVE